MTTVPPRDRNRKRQSGVYAIINEQDQKRYIGSSVNITKRWTEHRRTLRANSHQNSRLQRAWNKYGENAFTFALLELVEDNPTLLCEREQYYFALYSPGYNILPQAYSGNGAVRTEAEKKHLRRINEGKKYTPERKAAHKAAMNRPEVKAKMLARPKRTASPATRAKMSATQLEVQNRPEVKERQRQSQRDKKMPREAVESARQKRTGQKRTIEQREHMSQSRLQWYAERPEVREQQSRRAKEQGFGQRRNNEHSG